MLLAIHAASNTHPNQYAADPIGSLMTNVLGTYNLLNYAKRNCHFKRFVFVSSVEIYGEPLNPTDKFAEDYCGYIDCNTLRAAYPEGKRAGETLCNAFAKQHGIDFVIPRLSRVYGATMRSDDSKAMSQFIRNGVNDEDIVLKSKGEQCYSYCYVADAVSGILHTWFKGESGKAYNIADDDVLPLKDITKIIADFIGKKVVFNLPDEQEKIGFSKVSVGILNNTKIKQLGWQAHDNLETGLKKTISILCEQGTIASLSGMRITMCQRTQRFSIALPSSGHSVDHCVSIARYDGSICQPTLLNGLGHPLKLSLTSLWQCGHLSSSSTSPFELTPAARFPQTGHDSRSISGSAFHIV